MASSTAPRVLVVLAVRLFMTCSRLISFDFFIRNLRYSFDLFSGFHQRRIPRHTCRFYCCLAAHQRTKEKDSAEPLSSILWTPPPHPGEIRCGGALLLPRVYTNLGSCIPVQVAYPQFRILFGYLCSALYRSRFSRFCWADVVRFSLLGGGAVRACGSVWFCFFFRRICADRG